MAATTFLTAPEHRPEGGRIAWTRAKDGTNLRIAIWPHEHAYGTVLWFTGRTEYIEKYGPAAREMARRGFASATLDWRGQGLSDRPLPDPDLGHVEKFLDYQQDVNAFLNVVHEAGLPQPYHLVAHSMGGAIGLRSLMLGLDVGTAVFSGPMWGLKMSPLTRVMAAPFGRFLESIGRGNKRAPGTDADKYYVGSAPFENNRLTGDEAMYRFMFETLVVNPPLGLAGPTVRWVLEAMRECEALQKAKLPEVFTEIALGSEETVVDPQTIRDMAERWPSAKLRVYEGARHEIMMETPDLRAAFFDDCAARFSI